MDRDDGSFVIDTHVVRGSIVMMVTRLCLIA